MRGILASGYSSKDGIEVFVRDGAYATAADDDNLMVWDNENDFENNGNEIGIFKKSAIEPSEPPIDYDEDAFDEALAAGQPVELVVNIDNETVTDFDTGDTVIVKLRGKVSDTFDGGLLFEYYDDMEDDRILSLYYYQDDFIDIEKVKTFEHPPPGGFANLEFEVRKDLNGKYMLGVDGNYYGVSTNVVGMSASKDSTGISKVTKV